MRYLLTTALAMLVWTEVAMAQTPGGSAQAGPFSVSAEALVWWFKESPAPVPLVTDGIIGQPGTKVLLGGQDLDTGANPGFRVTAGYAPSDEWGIEGSFFYILPRSTETGVSSSGQIGSTDLIVPFFDVTTNRENGTELSFSPIYRGSATEKLKNSLLGAELNATWAVVPDGPVRVELLGGSATSGSVRPTRSRRAARSSPPFPQDIWNTKDEFDATNNFYGPQLGVRGRFGLVKRNLDGGVSGGFPHYKAELVPVCQHTTP